MSGELGSAKTSQFQTHLDRVVEVVLDPVCYSFGPLCSKTVSLKLSPCRRVGVRPWGRRQAHKTISQTVLDRALGETEPTEYAEIHKRQDLLRELARTVMEAEKSHSLLSVSWRAGKASGVIQSVQRLRMGSRRCGPWSSKAQGARTYKG